MLNYFFGNCNCMSSNVPDMSADIELFNLDIIEVSQYSDIKIFLDLKFSLNCTTVQRGDILYLSKYHDKIKKNLKFKGTELNENNIIEIDDDNESSYSGLVQNTFTLDADLYCVLYLRPQLKYDKKNSNWKVLGVSKAFKLDLLEEEESLYGLRKSMISMNNKTNLSIMELFNKSIIASPCKRELEEIKGSRFNVLKGDENLKKKNIFSKEDLESFKDSSTFDFTDNIENCTNESKNNTCIMKKNNGENKDAIKFYNESLEQIKLNQNFILSPHSRLLGKNKQKN